jgi:glycosyltransferase involved in cell wall biosynthesis
MTGDLPSISIVTPVFNGAAYLEELIESVRAQDYPRIEHIVIDDGSTDGGATAAVLKRHPHLRWWSRENRGQYATMNEGLAAASGEWICFVSADDMVTPGACRCAAEFLRSRPDLDGVVGRVQCVDATGGHYSDPPFQTMPLRYYAYLHNVSHCSLYVNRSKLLNNDLFFDPVLRYVGDYEWLVRVVHLLQLERLDRCLASIRIHHAQTSRQQRRKMLAEQRGVVAARNINPAAFFLCRNAYILLHNGRKLQSAIRTKGFRGGMQLFTRHFRRSGRV